MSAYSRLNFVRPCDGSEFYDRLLSRHRDGVSCAADFRALCGYASCVSPAGVFGGDGARAELCARLVGLSIWTSSQSAWLLALSRQTDGVVCVERLGLTSATFHDLSSPSRSARSARSSRRHGFLLLCAAFVLLGPTAPSAVPLTHAGVLLSVYDWHDRDSVAYARLLHGALLHVGLCA